MKSLEDYLKPYGFNFEYIKNDKPEVTYYVYSRDFGEEKFICFKTQMLPDGVYDYSLIAYDNDRKVTMFRIFTDNINDVTKQLDWVNEIKRITGEQLLKREKK